MTINLDLLDSEENALKFFGREQLLNFGLGEEDLKNIRMTPKGYFGGAILDYLERNRGIKPQIGYIQVYSLSEALEVNLCRVMGLKDGEREIVVSRGEGDKEDLYVPINYVPYLIKTFGLETKVEILETKKEPEAEITRARPRINFQEAKEKLVRLRTETQSYEVPVINEIEAGSPVKDKSLEDYSGIEERKGLAKNERINEETLSEEKENFVDPNESPRKLNKKQRVALFEEPEDYSRVSGGEYEKIIERVICKAREMPEVEDWQLSNYDLERFARKGFLEVIVLELGDQSQSREERLESHALDMIQEYVDMLLPSPIFRVDDREDLKGIYLTRKKIPEIIKKA